METVPKLTLSVFLSSRTFPGGDFILLTTLTAYGISGNGPRIGQRMKQALYFKFQFSRITCQANRINICKVLLTQLLTYLNPCHHRSWSISGAVHSSLIPKPTPHLFRSTSFCGSDDPDQFAIPPVVVGRKYEKLVSRSVDNLPGPVGRAHVSRILWKALLRLRGQHLSPWNHRRIALLCRI